MSVEGKLRFLKHRAVALLRGLAGEPELVPDLPPARPVFGGETRPPGFTGDGCHFHVIQASAESEHGVEVVRAPGLVLKRGVTVVRFGDLCDRRRQAACENPFVHLSRIVDRHFGVKED